mgnify:CR=1 FL=1
MTEIDAIMENYRLILHLRLAFKALAEERSQQPVFEYHGPDDSTRAYVEAGLPAQGPKKVNLQLFSDGRLVLTPEYWEGNLQSLPDDLSETAELILKGRKTKTYKFEPGTRTANIKNYTTELGIRPEPEYAEIQRLDLELRLLKK